MRVLLANQNRENIFNELNNSYYNMVSTDLYHKTISQAEVHYLTCINYQSLTQDTEQGSYNKS